MLKKLKTKKDEIMIMSFFALPIAFIITFFIWMEFLSPMAQGLKQMGM